MQLISKFLFVCFLCCAVSALHCQQVVDTTKLKDVIVEGFKNKNSFSTLAPTQQFNLKTLQQLNSFSAGDAAKYFSGVLIKDYGGIGGLKTISVRSLGASQTGILYDDVSMTDAQSGQIDLSKISITFLQRMSLYNGGDFNALMPARSYSYAAILSAYTIASFTNAIKQDWKLGLSEGSFGLWQPFAGITFPVSKKTFINASAEAIIAKGNYPFYIDNGAYSKKANRNNSDIKSLNGEVNITTRFNDSSAWKTKAAIYTSDRGLPGAIVFFNDRSAQRLWNTDASIQTVYNSNIINKIPLLVSAKYTHSYTRYLDPDYLNNQGKLDENYNQNEGYISAALAYNFNQSILISYASDAAYVTLQSNKEQFASPSRLSLWNVLGAQYNKNLLRVAANVLYTNVQEDVKLGTAANNKDKFTPAVALSLKPTTQSPLLFRAFYKRIFRLPTFNDLYYNLVGNISLKPEYTNQYNAGITFTKFISQKINNISISADGYYNTVKDKIITVPNKNLFVWSTLNLGKVDIRGVDVNAEAAGKFSNAWNWFIRAAYTYQYAVDVTDKNSSAYKNQIPYTPKNSGSGIAQLEFKTWRFSYSNIFSGSRYTLGDNIPANKVSGWITHDVSLSKMFDARSISILIKTELSNITNERYDVVKYFPMQGRSYRISISINKI